ncbi:MAG: hypothetical protein HKM95_03415 [Inquilinus sp.]|nr:hypothetical protein [Inquilinus sp.]
MESQNRRDKKYFVLGVGAQKAGTTWLHSYLSSIECVDLGIFKEYHMFDSMNIPECKYFRSDYSIKSNLKKLIRKTTNRDYYNRFQFQDCPDKYFDYFAKILSENKSITVTGDITPSYSGLPVECYKDIHDNFERRNVKVKVIFLLRDPLERCWSAVRMHRRGNKTNFENVDTQLNEEDALRNYYKTRNAEFRTRYDQTIQNLEAVFDGADIFVSFYETFLKSGTGEVERLAKFLDIQYTKPNYSRKLNVSKKNDNISDELKTEIVMHYSDVYRFAFDRYGRDFVAEIWSGAKYLI